MSDERDFVNGMIIKKPNDNAPDWVKAKVSIKLDDFKGWIGGFVKANPEGFTDCELSSSSFHRMCG